MGIGTIYEDDEQVGLLTRQAFEQTGSKLLQIHRFFASDGEHVSELLRIFDPRRGSVIADVGCGAGRVAELMSEQRPDLEFILINKSASQLAMCPARFPALIGTAEVLPLECGDVDAIMATYVLGHVDLQKFVTECERVLKPNGRVYLFDLFRRDELEKCRLKEDLDYAERTVEEMDTAFISRGFSKVCPTHSTYYVPDEINALMPHEDTLFNTVSAAMVFRKVKKNV
jgi:ubiquinone/menaquinone biosynthesis C-methylase UbiE